ncbi:hypothetical protein KY342_00405 [Candidatus Woesearchaeota archaeon]|nr:hypothetical protein [Candidatus Woesearchaeota archaeon]
MTKYTDLEFPETGVSAFDFTRDVLGYLVNQTNGLIITNLKSEQKQMEEKLAGEVLYKPSLLIEKGTLLEFAPTKMYNGEWKELTGIVMPLYRVGKEKGNKWELEAWFEDEWMAMNYKNLKGSLDSPMQIAEIIPALQRLSANDLESVLIHISVKRYARIEGREKLVEEYSKQLLDMFDKYHKVQKVEYDSKQLDKEAIAKDGHDSKIINELFHKKEEDSYDLLAHVPVVDQHEELMKVQEQKRIQEEAKKRHQESTRIYKNNTRRVKFE